MDSDTLLRLLWDSQQYSMPSSNFQQLSYRCYSLQCFILISHLTTLWPKISALVQGNLAAASDDTLTLWHGASFYKREEACQTESWCGSFLHHHCPPLATQCRGARLTLLLTDSLPSDSWILLFSCFLNKVVNSIITSSSLPSSRDHIGAIQDMEEEDEERIIPQMWFLLYLQDIMCYMSHKGVQQARKKAQIQLKDTGTKVIRFYCH